MEEYNINQHIVKRLINRFGGSQRKETVMLDDGNQYLLKLPDPTREDNRILSYINNAISEYIGCKIIKEIGLPVQEVILGEYTNPSYSTGEMKTYIACACKNLEENGYSLAEAERTSLGSDADTKGASVPSFSTIPKIAQYTPGITEEEIRHFYAEQFVVDALIGNKDRHNGNWGFLTGMKGSMIAPIYDCGSSLCPLYEDSELTETIAVNDALNGLSAIRGEHGKQLSYREFLIDAGNEDVNAALKRILPKINMEHIHKIVDDTPYISQCRKDFYNVFLDTKYTRVLLPALEHVITKSIGSIDNSDRPSNVYDYYSKVIKPWTEYPLFERKTFHIQEQEFDIMKVSTKYIILIDSHTDETINVITTRSNNEEAFENLKRLCLGFDFSLEKLASELEEGINMSKNEK